MRRRTSWIGAILLSSAWGFIDGFYVAPLPIAFWLTALAGAACLVIDAVGSVPPRRATVAEALFDTLTVTAIQLSLQPVLPVLMAHLHRIPGAAQAAAPV